jgi:TolA protein
MGAVALPPNRPAYPGDRELSNGLKWSAIAHLGLMTAFLLKSLVFPGTSQRYIPSLRVDIVGLPDQLKNEKRLPSPVDDKIKEALKQAEQKEAEAKAEKKKAEKVEKADPDEMVVKPKKAKEEGAEKNREKKMKSALDRIKSLSKIQEDAPSALPIKGNKISKGTSLSGDAAEAAEASYFDLVRDRLQNFWELPVWLQRQKLTAQAQIFIDSRGKLRSFRITRSSGNEKFDEEVKRTLTQSQPFPLPPEGIASSVLVDGISVGFPL